MDAYTGAILWTRVLPGINRFNIPRNTANWCANSAELHIAIGGECLVLDTATGKMKRWISLPKEDGGEEWSHIARVGNTIFGGSYPKGTRRTNYRGAAGWYDAKNNYTRQIGCSKDLFAVEARTGKVKWRYVPNGVILNPTITVADGSLFFIEAGSLKAREKNPLRFPANKLAENPLLTRLNAATGEVEFKIKTKINDNPKFPVEMVSLAYGENSLAYLVSRTDKKPFGTYFLTVFNAADGSIRYEKQFKWGGKDHGGHMSRPVIAAGRLTVRPWIFNLKSGETLNKNKFKGSCGTYAASKNLLFTRSSGPLSVWNLDGTKLTKSGWKRLRPGCWLSFAPACGMLLAPEGGGGCRCGVWLETSAGFIPRKLRTP
jgi:outer membrane protein assembly factor BamB